MCIRDRPWNLAKSTDSRDRDKLNIMLYTLIESIRLSSLMLSPIMPLASRKILEQIGIELKDDEFNLSRMGDWGSYKGQTKLKEREILFPRIKEE